MSTDHLQTLFKRQERKRKTEIVRKGDDVRWRIKEEEWKGFCVFTQRMDFKKVSPLLRVAHVCELILY